MVKIGGVKQPDPLHPAVQVEHEAFPFQCPFVSSLVQAQVSAPVQIPCPSVELQSLTPVQSKSWIEQSLP